MLCLYHRSEKKLLQRICSARKSIVRLFTRQHYLGSRVRCGFSKELSLICNYNTACKNLHTTSMYRKAIWPCGPYKLSREIEWCLNSCDLEIRYRLPNILCWESIRLGKCYADIQVKTRNPDFSVSQPYDGESTNFFIYAQTFLSEFLQNGCLQSQLIILRRNVSCRLKRKKSQWSTLED